MIRLFDCTTYRTLKGVASGKIMAAPLTILPATTALLNQKHCGIVPVRLVTSAPLHRLKQSEPFMLSLQNGISFQVEATLSVRSEVEPTS